MAGQHPNHIPTRKEKKGGAAAAGGGERRCTKERGEHLRARPPTFHREYDPRTHTHTRTGKKKNSWVFFFFCSSLLFKKKKKKRGRHQPDAKQIGDAAFVTDGESRGHGHADWRSEADGRPGIWPRRSAKDAGARGCSSQSSFAFSKMHDRERGGGVEGDLTRLQNSTT